MCTIKKKKNIYITHMLRSILIYYIKSVGESRNIYIYIYCNITTTSYIKKQLFIIISIGFEQGGELLRIVG